MATSEALTAFLSASTVLKVSAVLAVAMLIWDTIEVGRNDAANLVNAVFGARILSQRTAVWVAGAGVVFGAAAASTVIETTRNGIFEPSMLGTVEKAVAVYVSVYIVDTVLLYGYSAFGMPVSTTACLVFALLGASFALGGHEIVHWSKAGQVVSAIIISIFISGMVGFLVQRAVRGAIRDGGDKLATLLMHGGWVGGGMLAGMGYFMLVRGMAHVGFVQAISQAIRQSPYGMTPVFLGSWAAAAIAIHVLLVMFGRQAAKRVFPVLAIIGTVCMGFAFGQNDLANCAAPGLSALTLIRHWEEGPRVASSVEIPWYFLGVCGLILLAGMTTRNAARVTEAQVGAGSMSNTVALWAPRWCIRLARRLLKNRRHAVTLAPPPRLMPGGETTHYDAVRACTILTVSASVIATASGLGLPVSTTYVTFAAVVATGAADRIMQRGDAELKLARTIWVVFSWFAAAAIAAVAACLVSWSIDALGIIGIVGGLGGNLALRQFLGKRGDAQEKWANMKARERMHPEQFTEYEG